jgi:hypothetical protein
LFTNGSKKVTRLTFTTCINNGDNRCKITNEKINSIDSKRRQSLKNSAEKMHMQLAKSKSNRRMDSFSVETRWVVYVTSKSQLIAFNNLELRRTFNILNVFKAPVEEVRGLYNYSKNKDIQTAKTVAIDKNLKEEYITKLKRLGDWKGPESS